MFFLFANCNFISGHYDDWQAAYDDLATYVWSNEPTTIGYYFGIPLDYAHAPSQTTSMFAFEIYGKREDLYETHLSSPAMAKFLAAIPAYTTTDLDLSHYSALPSSILDRTGTKAPCAFMHDTRILCHSATARQMLLSHLQNLVTLIHEAVKKDAKGVLTFMGFESLDDEVSLRIFSRFETREAMEEFWRREEWVGFWREGRGEVARMEPRAYVWNGKGWLHRGGERVELGKAV